jgi:GAF domain-containing protein
MSFKGIFENTTGGLLGLGVIALAAWGISRVDAPVALWLVFLVALLCLLVGFVIGRVSEYGNDLLGYQTDLVGEAILALREVLAGSLSVPFEEFIERGLLAPALFGLSAERGEKIRLSVLTPRVDGQTFQMLYESGHSVGRKNNFSLTKVSLAGHAFETGELEWTNDVEKDDRWQPHPKASRTYGSLACMPIVVGDSPVAVLNVVSSAKGAFLRGDLMFIELLGGFIGLAWALNDYAAPSSNLPVSEDSEPSDRKGS